MGNCRIICRINDKPRATPPDTKSARCERKPIARCGFMPGLHADIFAIVLGRSKRTPATKNIDDSKPKSKDNIARYSFIFIYALTPRISREERVGFIRLLATGIGKKALQSLCNFCIIVFIIMLYSFIIIEPCRAESRVLPLQQRRLKSDFRLMLGRHFGNSIFPNRLVAFKTGESRRESRSELPGGAAPFRDLISTDLKSVDDITASQGRGKRSADHDGYWILQKENAYLHSLLLDKIYWVTLSAIAGAVLYRIFLWNYFSRR